MKLLNTLGIAIAGLMLLAAPVSAAEGQMPSKDIGFSFEGAFGKFDRGQLQRGYKVYKEVCAACHSLKFVAFRNLGDAGGPHFTEAEVKALAAGYDVAAIDNETGEATTRKGLPSDHIPAPFPNEIAAKAANNGSAPPDLSLMAKAREGNASYIHAILTGYDHPVPEGVQVPEGGNYNPYFPGGVIAMPKPLSDGQVEYADASVPRTVDQYAKDVSAFLMWTAEPKMEVRKRVGFGAILFLGALSVLLYLSYRRVWRNVDH